MLKRSLKSSASTRIEVALMTAQFSVSLSPHTQRTNNESRAFNVANRTWFRFVVFAAHFINRTGKISDFEWWRTREIEKAQMKWFATNHREHCTMHSVHVHRIASITFSLSLPLSHTHLVTSERKSTTYQFWLHFVIMHGALPKCG